MVQEWNYGEDKFGIGMDVKSAYFCRNSSIKLNVGSIG